MKLKDKQPARSFTDLWWTAATALHISHGPIMQVRDSSIDAASIVWECL